MKVLFANITNYLENVPNPADLLPKETARVNEWKNQGLVENLFVRSNGSALLVFKEIDEARARELVETLPLFPYFDQVDYVEMDKRF